MRTDAEDRSTDVSFDEELPTTAHGVGVSHSPHERLRSRTPSSDSPGRSEGDSPVEEHHHLQHLQHQLHCHRGSLPSSPGSPCPGSPCPGSPCPGSPQQRRASHQVSGVELSGK